MKKLLLTALLLGSLPLCADEIMPTESKETKLEKPKINVQPLKVVKGLLKAAAGFGLVYIGGSMAYDMAKEVRIFGLRPFKRRVVCPSAISLAVIAGGVSLLRDADNDLKDLTQSPKIQVA